MFKSETFETILQRVLDRVPDTMDKREGGIIYDAIAPVAAEFAKMYIDLTMVFNETYADTASRPYLIRRVAERGITPKEATNAVLKGTFKPASLQLKFNSRFSCDNLNYKVVEKLEDGSYLLECETAGIIGNGTFGQLIPIEYVQGLETATLDELVIPARDEEETEALRQRYFDSFDKRAYGGNIADYVEKTNDIQGVGATKVTPVWNGGGTVLLTILDSDYNKASSVLVNKVQVDIDPTQDGQGKGIAPIGHFVTVQSVSEVPINVTATFLFTDSYSFINSKTKIEETIKNYLLELRKQWADMDTLTVRTLQIESRIIQNVQGIVDISNTKINGSRENLSVSRYSIPVWGSVADE